MLEIDANDNHGLSSYRRHMEAGAPFIRLKLDTDQPIELGEFVGAFTAISAEYDRYMRANEPDMCPDASLFIKEIRAGCIEADLIPWLVGGGLIGVLAAANTIHEFVERYGGRISTYLKPNGRAEGATKGELQHIVDQVAAVASNPGSNLQIAAIDYENGKERARIALKFDTEQARKIEERVQEHTRELERSTGLDHERVLMIFTRSDVRPAPTGKRSGELVCIPSISDRSIPLVYASDLAEQAIKHEIAEAEDNVYKKGFQVDVNVEERAGRILAYRVTNLHSVIDLPDD